MLEFIAGLIGGDISAGLWQRKKRSNGAHYAMAAAGALLLIALIATSLLLD